MTSYDFHIEHVHGWWRGEVRRQGTVEWVHVKAARERSGLLDNAAELVGPGVLLLITEF